MRYLHIKYFRFVCLFSFFCFLSVFPLANAEAVTIIVTSTNTKIKIKDGKTHVLSSDEDSQVTSTNANTKIEIKDGKIDIEPEKDSKVLDRLNRLRGNGYLDFAYVRPEEEIFSLEPNPSKNAKESANQKLWIRSFAFDLSKDWHHSSDIRWFFRIAYLSNLIENSLDNTNTDDWNIQQGFVDFDYYKKVLFMRIGKIPGLLGFEQLEPDPHEIDGATSSLIGRLTVGYPFGLQIKYEGKRWQTAVGITDDPNPQFSTNRWDGAKNGNIDENDGNFMLASRFDYHLVHPQSHSSWKFTCIGISGQWGQKGNKEENNIGHLFTLTSYANISYQFNEKHSLILRGEGLYSEVNKALPFSVFFPELPLVNIDNENPLSKKLGALGQQGTELFLMYHFFEKYTLGYSFGKVWNYILNEISEVNEIFPYFAYSYSRQRLFFKNQIYENLVLNVEFQRNGEKSRKVEKDSLNNNVALASFTVAF